MKRVLLHIIIKQRKLANVII